ncbi:hypothetical protein [Roseicella sp. DB1501]|uniref:hypothetical protein n=1 Tax=Roseicella sp. DB1501 TaxID=2730925 RepID=UPI0014928556|nr:hypothetical protein [Roseicella sp. DB1501]NOG72279.1 hypothetical protein [Roseicella sp. DB1501]
MRRRLALLACLGLTATGLAQEPDAARSGATLQDGLRIAWRYLPQADPGIGTLEVEIADAESGAPVRYERGRLVAWLQRRRAALPEAEIACADRVRLLARQGIGQRADIDLNTYRLVTLNADGSLAVINPFVPLNNAKLETILELGGTPRGWLLIPERLEAWVVLSAPARLVQVDLQARRIGRAIALPEAPGEAMLAWHGPTGQLWLALAGRDGLGLVAPDRAEAALRLLPGPAPTALLAAEALDGPVTGHADGVVALHLPEASRRWRVPGGGAVRLLRHSLPAGRIVAAMAAGSLAWIDPAAPDGAPPERLLPLGHPVTALALADGGRRALALGGGRASLVDLATGQVEARMETLPQAHELLLTDRFAYAVSLPEGRGTLWPLAELRQGRVSPVEVTLGRAEAGLDIGPAARAAPVPAGNGILVAVPADGMVYQYGEGMMAPIGSYSNYRRAALGLHVLDLSPREVAPGRYRSPVRHGQGGPHELVLAGASPRFAACGPLQLPATAAAAALPRTLLGAALQVALAGIERRGEAGTAIRVRVSELADGASRPVGDLADLELLLFDPRTAWEARAGLRPEGEAGHYAASLTLPAGARPEAMVASPSRHLSFATGHLGPLPMAAAR